MIIHRNRKLPIVALPALLLVSASLEGAELSVGNVVMLADTTADVVVSGSVPNELTFGVELLVEIVSRGGNSGSVTFTVAPLVDIVQVGDPWPTAGSFSAFDTDYLGFSLTLNGSADEDGQSFCDQALSFNGPLTSFPVVASADAVGVWDVFLLTSAGESLWYCPTTTLIAGTITVSAAECLLDTDCDDLVTCTDDTCPSGSCVFTANDANCPDDTVFCNGNEVCDSVLDCVSTGNPCQAGEFCNETFDTCDECQVEADCNDGVGCTDDTCPSGSCLFTANDANCLDDGLFCTGTEMCDSLLDCVSTGNPCLPQVCDEPSDTCVPCTTGPDCDDGDVCTDDGCNAGLCEYTYNTAPCDDGRFCTATDVCSGGVCVGVGDPCSGQLCDETNDICLPEAAALMADDLILSRGETAELVVSGAIAGEPTFGVEIFLEIVPRAGSVGTVTYTLSPPVDIVERGDPWPDAGIFSAFDTDSLAYSETLNGSVSDNGTYEAAPVVYLGLLTGFPVKASDNAGGVWDAVLSTSSGNSSWEGVPTTLNAGTITVPPSASLSVTSLAMPPDEVVDVVVSGDVDGETSSEVNIFLEIVGRPGNAGTLEFTWSPLPDIVQLGDPWAPAGTFSAFDTNSSGFSTSVNGSLHGTFTPTMVVFSGELTAFPVQASFDADGVWDLVLLTSVGQSGWADALTALTDGTVTVSATACLIDTDCDDVDPCTDDVCILGACEYSHNTASCDDSNPCTENDVCASGVCAGTPVLDGGACDDGDPCNLGETCLSGICQGSSPVDCSAAGDDCNIASCDPGGTEGNCDVFTPVADGTPCDDGAPCNVGETCQFAVCVGSAPVDCSSADDQCNIASCDPAGAEGNCSILTPTNEGVACDDGNPCAVGETCQSGACTGGSPPDCLGAGDQCNIASCDPLSGEGNCDILTPVLNGTACDDTDSCNVGEACQSGICTGGGLPDCSGAGDQCNTAACDPAGAEGNCDDLTATNEGLACDDTDRCTDNDTCVGGSCVGTSVDCSVFDDVCNVGVCDPLTGICRAQPTNEGGACDDGLPCTINDLCSNGTCSGTLVDPLTVNLEWLPAMQTVLRDELVQIELVAVSGTCAEQAVGSIQAILNWDPSMLALTGKTDTGPFPWLSSSFPNDSGLDGLNAPFTGTPDNDGDLFYQALASFTSGAEVTPAGLVVTSFEFLALDGTLGTQITIPPTAGLFTSTRVLGAEDTLGLDVTGILGTATVRIIECQVEVDCYDGDICTDDNCVSGVCENPLNTAPCEDGLFCTSNDACSNDVCVGGPDPCTAPSLCSEDLGACVECLDLADCDDGNVCTDDLCNGVGACENPNNTLPCDDGLFCTLVDTCSGGTCVGSDDTCPGQVCDEPNDQCVQCLEPLDCFDGNLCTDDICSANVCANPPNVLPCEDGLFCTSDDTCSDGGCVGGVDPCMLPLLCSEAFDACVQCLSDADCDNGNVCTTDVCSFGLCSNTNNTAPCEDGLFCTATGTCSGGACAGSGDACPGELCDEVNDRCVECLTAGDCDDSNVCTDNTCSDDVCVYLPNVLPCDDGLFCTSNDTCSDGGCVGGADPCIPPSLCSETLDECVQCLSDAGCDDGDVCTTDVCSLGTCSNTNNTVPCDDGLFCTATDLCSGGVCVGSGFRCPGELCDEPNDRCIECFVVGDCDEDFVGCTDDACDVDGRCTYTPNDAPCDDGVFCNGPEFCHPTLDCQPAVNPCDDPTLCDEANDSCGCQEPVVVAEGCRYLAVTPRPGVTPVALLVTGVDLEVSCVSLYVQADGTLGETPVYRPPGGGPNGWGTAHVRGLEIKPSTTYVVQTECDTGAGIGLSTLVSDTTWLWGDADNSGDAGIVDVLLILNGFRGFFNSVVDACTEDADCPLPWTGCDEVAGWCEVTRQNLDLYGSVLGFVPCAPNAEIEIIDVLFCLDVFRGSPYPCDDPCP